MANHRDDFAGSAIASKGPSGEEQVWKIVYMVQTPLYVAVCRMRHAPEAMAIPSSGTSVESTCDAAMAFIFRMNFAEMATAADLPHQPRRHHGAPAL